jgi:methyl-accepting chemotaxis protein
MSQQVKDVVAKRRFSLSIYISLILALTATFPLLVTVGSIEVSLRPALIAQVSADMEKDAQTRIQLIDSYLAERKNDIQTLSESPLIKGLLAGDQTQRTLATNMLFNVQHRDIANYISLSLLNQQGNVILTYPGAPLKHGNYLILPEARQQLQQTGQIYISDVFYDPIGNAASIDYYARVVNNAFQTLGYVRATIGLHRIWEPVDSEPQANGPGSYAIILDENNVRIAYTNPDHAGFQHPTYLFKAISPISSQLQQRIKDEDLYGNSTTAVATVADQNLADIQSNPQSPSTFPIDQNEGTQSYQAARYTSTIAPWTYVIFKPMGVVTGIADQQLFSIIATVVIVLVLAVGIGVITGRRIAQPIARSVRSLRRNSVSLKTLANEEHTVATEQSWMVEASQVAQESVKYYTKAASIAARRIHTIGTELTKNPRSFDAFKLQRSLQEMVEAAEYIERAIHHQENMNEKLATALRVTTQATEQLTKGAKSTDDAATQLEYIVGQLTAVVGERATDRESQE